MAWCEKRRASVQVFFVAGDGGHVGKYLVHAAVLTAQHILNLGVGEVAVRSRPSR